MIIKILTTISGIPHQASVAGIKARDIRPQLNKCFYKEHWNVFLQTFRLWIDTHLNTDNILHGSGRTMKK